MVAFCICLLPFDKRSRGLGLLCQMEWGEERHCLSLSRMEKAPIPILISICHIPSHWVSTFLCKLLLLLTYIGCEWQLV